MSDENGRVEREVTLPVEREQVWQALTDPDLLREWLADEVELDLREGGDAVFRYESGEERSGTVEELVEGERLRLRWERRDGAASDVEFVLADAVSGTRLRVVERAPACGPCSLGTSHARLIALGVLSRARRPTPIRL